MTSSLLRFTIQTVKTALFGTWLRLSVVVLVIAVILGHFFNWF